jgi:DNA-directed RNA polymerase specialized sigma24 family protein
VLLLLYFEDMSYREAGKAMNKSEKQIKHLAFRAKKALKKKLESMNYVIE